MRPAGAQGAAKRARSRVTRRASRGVVRRFRRAARDLEAAIEFRVTEADGGATLHTLLITDSRCRVRHGVVAEPDLTIELSAADLFRIAAGVVDGVALAMDSRLRLSGDLALAFRLPRRFRPGRRSRPRTAEDHA